MIRFVEIINDTNFNPRLERTSKPCFTVSEIWINPQYVVSIREARGYTSLVREGHLPQDLSPSHQFTTVELNNSGIVERHVVVGPPHIVAQRLERHEAQLLKG